MNEVAGQRREWLAAGAVVLLCLVAATLYRALTIPMVIQDDQRQHVVPFQHFLPGRKLPRDLIVDFFLSENGALYRALYAGPASIGVAPTDLAWLVGALCLGLSLWAMHRLMRALGAGEAAALVATVLLIAYLGLRDDLASGSARALGWPLMIGALAMLAERRRIAFAVAVSVAALVYPTVAVLALATAGLLLLGEALAARDWRMLLAWVAVPLVPMLILAGWAGEGRWGPTISAATARQLAEFGEGGRAEYFVANPFAFYLTEMRSGLTDRAIRWLAPVPIVALAGLVRRVVPPSVARLALALGAASLLLWAAAHLLLFRLYLPSRYAIYGINLAWLILAAATVARWRRHTWIAPAVVALYIAVLTVAGKFPHFGLKAPRAPGLMAMMRDDPRGGAVGGLSDDLAFVPRFTQRSVMWNGEAALPYKTGYRAAIATRLRDDLGATFAASPAPLLAWAQRERVAFLLVDSAFLAPGPLPRLIAGAPGGLDRAIPPRDAWPRAWIAGERGCARTEAGVLLFSLSCLARRAALNPRPIRPM